MTINQNNLFPEPDRSDFMPNQYKDDETLPEIDLGFSTGLLSDGRPYRSELWCTEGTTLLTYFFSTLHLEGASPEILLSLLDSNLTEQGVPQEYRVIDEEEIFIIEDASGNPMYSLTFIVGMDG